MPLQELCRFLSRLVRIPVTIADTPSALRDFCENARFHRVQEHLTPSRLTELFSSLAEAEILSVNDAFQIRFILFKALGTPVIFGPFCSESLSTIDARILLERSGVSRSHAQDFLAYRAAFTVTSEQDALRAVRILVFQLTGLDQLPPIRSAHFAAPSSVIPDTAPDRPYAETVSERYAVETDMMRAIEHGNTARALTDWRQLHQRMDYLKKQLGYTLGNAQFSAAVTRTVIRVAGMNAGVPAHILDDLTGRVSQANRQAKTLDEIEMNTERLIRDLCREIRHREKDNVSYLTESVKYQIHTHFHEDLTVAAIADHLDVSESRLIELFRSETGTTPGAYLRRVRMNAAADLLTGTRRPVQQIASDVGIADANYFVKLFRREYGVTPSAYRRAGE